MSKQISNTQIKTRFIRIILSIVFTLSAVLFINQSPVYAATDFEMSGHTTGNIEVFDEDSFNGENAGGNTHKLSYVYWAGTTDRLGYLMYFVDTYSGEILSEQTTF